MNYTRHHTPIPKKETPRPGHTGPVTYSHMSKEEIERRYGHIKPRKKEMSW